MRKILPILILAFTPVLVAAGEINCKTIKGEFEIYNGWPPTLRLEDKTSKRVYGVMEISKIPSGMREILEQNQKVSGSFCLRETGKTTKVPYMKIPIILVDVVSYEVK